MVLVGAEYISFYIDVQIVRHSCVYYTALIWLLRGIYITIEKIQCVFISGPGPDIR